MTIHDDPRLTAYVLGELDDAERAAVDVELAASAQGRAAVAEIRGAAGRVEAALAAEGMLGLAQEMEMWSGRPRPLSDDGEPAAEGDRSFRATQAARRVSPRRLFWIVPAGAGIAAALALLVTTPWVSRIVAKRDPMTSTVVLSDWDGDGAQQLAFGPPLTDSPDGVTRLNGAPITADDYFRSGAVVVRSGQDLAAGPGPLAGIGQGEHVYSNDNTEWFPQHYYGSNIPQPPFHSGLYHYVVDALNSPARASTDPTRGLRKQAARQIQDLLLENEETKIAWHLDVLYPNNWLEISAKRDMRDVPTTNAPPAEFIPGSTSGPAPNVEAVNSSQPEREAMREEIARQVAKRRVLLEQQRQEKVQQLFETGKQLQKEQRFAEAAESMRQVLLLDPANAQALNNLEIYEDFDSLSRQLEAANEPAAIPENPFLVPTDAPLSTFSIDVDTASYTIARQYLEAGQRPPPGMVRVEEMVNYFSYDYPPPTGDAPVSLNVEIAACPWQPEHRLARIGLKGRVVDMADAPACNLVFLIDVSGSMEPENRLPLIKQSLKLLVPQLGADDRIAIVTYAGDARVLLDSTPASRQTEILWEIDGLTAAGSTNGSTGIATAYDIASRNFIDGGINRVILATDGDFNVGVSDKDELAQLITDKAKSGVFLSILGVGMGNVRDEKLETLADKGNGHYAYLDRVDEAYRVLVEQANGTLLTIAKDVKIQVEFNPAAVAEYRLIGYEDRMLGAADFNNDAKDAGEIGSGHTVTALYEITPAGAMDFAIAQPPNAREGIPEEGGARKDSRTSDHGHVQSDLPMPPEGDIDPLKYQTPGELLAAAGDGVIEALTVKLRYKLPHEDVSRLIDLPVFDDGRSFGCASGDFRFASAVAGFGMLLRGSQNIGNWTFDAVLQTARAAVGDDPSGRRAEFVELVKKAMQP